MFALQPDPKLVSKLHDATVQILEEIGIELTHTETTQLLMDAGARKKNGRIYFGEKLIFEHLKKCPPVVYIRGRTKDKQIELGDGELYCHNLGGAAKVYDHKKKKSRLALVNDIAESTRLMDALDSISSITPLFTPTDVAGELMSIAMVRHTLPHTTKPIHGPGVATAEEVSFIHELAGVIGNPSEMISIGVSPKSTLCFPDSIAGAILKAAELKIPFGPLPCPIAGATSPMSLSGSIAQQNAEVMAAIIIAQLKQPGLPVFYCGRLSVIDPRTLKSRWSGPEVGKMSAVTVMLGHSYNLPVNVYGITSTTAIDEQRNFERMSNALLPALAKADEISGIGELECGQTSSLAQILFDIDIIDYVQHIRNGIQFDDELVSVIDKVVESGGMFIDQPHTVKHLRSKVAPAISYKKHELAQLAEGSLDWADNKLQDILKSHTVPPLEKQQEKEMDKIMKNAENTFLK